jgi:hypothetical protein
MGDLAVDHNFEEIEDGDITHMTNDDADDDNAHDDDDAKGPPADQWGEDDALQIHGDDNGNSSDTEMLEGGIPKKVSLFYDYLQDFVDDAHPHTSLDEVIRTKEGSPPSKTVAVIAVANLLALATSGWLHIVQDVPFADIDITFNDR